MFTIDGKNLDALFLGPAGNNFPGHDQGFLIGQRDVLFRVQRLHGRFQTGKAHHGSNHGIHAIKGSGVNKGLTAASQLCFAAVTAL